MKSLGWNDGQWSGDSLLFIGVDFNQGIGGACTQFPFSESLDAKFIRLSLPD